MKSLQKVLMSSLCRTIAVPKTPENLVEVVEVEAEAVADATMRIETTTMRIQSRKHPLPTIRKTVPTLKQTVQKTTTREATSHAPTA